MVLDLVALMAKPTVPKVDASLPRPSTDPSSPPFKAPISDEGPMNLP